MIITPHSVYKVHARTGTTHSESAVVVKALGFVDAMTIAGQVFDSIQKEQSWQLISVELMETRIWIASDDRH